jgi:hypothetical protein
MDMRRFRTALRSISVALVAGIDNGVAEDGEGSGEGRQDVGHRVVARRAEPLQGSGTIVAQRLLALPRVVISPCR